VILTVGHSTRTLDEWLALLIAHGVERVVDVRTIPRSRRYPHFGVDRLPASLAAAGIGYAHLPELGGLRRPRPDSSNLAWKNPSFRGYADHMQTAEFEAGLERLIALARRTRRRVPGVAIMCAEAVPWRCHRSLIADALHARGIEVAHILDADPARPHVPTAHARIAEGRVTYPDPAGRLDL
jgi:uncharacterized protein (DUF488 family)